MSRLKNQNAFDHHQHLSSTLTSLQNDSNSNNNPKREILSRIQLTNDLEQKKQEDRLQWNYLIRSQTTTTKQKEEVESNNNSITKKFDDCSKCYVSTSSSTADSSSSFSGDSSSLSQYKNCSDNHNQVTTDKESQVANTACLYSNLRNRYYGINNISIDSGCSPNHNPSRQVDIVAKNNEHIALNDNNTTKQNEQTQLIDVNEVESNDNKGGCVDGDVLRKQSPSATATVGTNPCASSSSQTESFATNVSIITNTNTSETQLNLKPILKRKDSIEINKNHPLQTVSILPPILRKRDSITCNDNINYVCSAQSLNTNINNAPKPLSILKNRSQQTKIGSHSFDDNISGPSSVGDIASPSDDNSQSNGLHLKPILKKKSWSTEEKVTPGSGGLTSSGSIANETVKGILKSSDKSNSSSTSSSKNSILDDIVSYTASNTIISSTTNSKLPKQIVNQNPISSGNLNTSRTVLKSILKSSKLKNNRSTSLSPCTSTDSLVDDVESIEHHQRGDVFLPNAINSKSAFHKRSSLDNDSSSSSTGSSLLFDSYEIFLKHQQKHQNTSNNNTNNDNPHLPISVINKTTLSSSSTSASSSTLNIKPILKRNSVDYHQTSDNNKNNEDHPSTPSVTETITNINLCNRSTTTTTTILQVNIDLNSEQHQTEDNLTNHNKMEKDSRMPSSSTPLSKSSDNNDDNNNVTLRTTNLNSQLSTGTANKARPKSCYIPRGTDEDIVNNNSISERLALLKQNGEQAWRNRLNKQDDTKDIQNNNDSSNGKKNIANRLSSLYDSQLQWKNRVPEKDAQKFTVASKLNQAANTTKVDDKVVLRETPKRSGLRGSSLSEKKLGDISSKLNCVLGKDKSPFSSPLKVKKDNVKESLTLNVPENSSTTAKQTDSIQIIKPDDEESFGSFFGLNDSTLEQIINQAPNEPSNISTVFDSIEDNSSSIKLLSSNKKTRVQAPKRRAASERNPVKLLSRTPIIVDSYQTNQSSLTPTSNEQPTISSTNATKIIPTKDDSKFAISALAGLASKEDFKSVANKLRNSSANGSSSLSRNDSWRTYDLKNSLQSKMLIWVKGRRKAHTRLVEPNWRSLNQMDSFILVTKENIYAYIGFYSNIIERTKCMEISELIKKRKDLCFRSSSNEVTLIDGQCSSVQSCLFEKMLPLLNELDFVDNDRIDFEKQFLETTNVIDLDEDDEFYEETINHSNMVYNVIYDEKLDSNEALLKPVESYCGRSPRHQILKQDVALVFDYGSEMYIWLGKCVSNVMRKKAVEAAKDLWLKGYDFSEFEYNPLGEKYEAKADKRPDWSWFIRVNQNMEPILFKDKFFNWPAFTLTRPEKKTTKKSTNVANEKKPSHKIVKKDLSAELNLFPVDVKNDMINKEPKEPNLILECFSLGRGAGDIINDEDGLPVKVVSLDWQCFYIDESGERVELSENDRNFLCSGESYYVRWKYRLTRTSRDLKTGGESRFSEQHGGRDRLCYFVWQGKDAKNTQRGLTALNAIEKLREEGASQTYIEYGNEDPVFLRIFQGSLIIQTGKRNQIANNKRYRMFMLNDTAPKEEFMVELECSFKNLRSRMSYVFVNPDNGNNIYIWHGVKTDEIKRQSIKKFVEEKILKNKSKEFGFNKKDFKYYIVELNEGKENNEFMDIFQTSNPTSPDGTLKRSSKSNLHRDIYFSLMDDPRPFDFTPRLFHFVTSSDQIFEAIEIIPSYLPTKTSNIVVSYPFVQDDLYDRAKNRPTFFLFDAGYEVFLWESKYPFFICNNKGDDEQKNNVPVAAPKMIDIQNEIQSECNTTTGFMSQLWLAERKCALESTLAYCHAKNSSEPPKSYVISAGLEPDAFCGLFPTWTYYDNVAKLHIQDGRKPGEQILVQEMLSQIQDINQSTYSYEELKRRPLPEGINILCLESYLDDEEFEKVFSMNREEFYSIPTWKQKIIKQEKELF